jgi:hypothetical protein
MQQDRNQKLFFEVQKEFEDKIENLKTKSDRLGNLYSSVMKKFESFVRTKCGSHLEWIEANTNMTDNGPVLKDPTKQDEFESTITKFESCIKSNDSGVQDVLMEMDNTIKSAENNFSEAYQKCVAINSDEESKKCIRNVLSENLSSMENFYTQFTNKFESFNNKL